jgi:cell fate (sporulation/competence/biofilm development) regulator YlbF (YheA/YmcA/DUF963 family)
VTDEGKNLTEKWIEDKGVRYAYAYDTSGKLYRETGGTGSLPHAALIDPAGIVRWKGHPGSISESEIEKALVGALPIPMWEWPKEASRVRKALQKEEYAKALEEAAKVEDGQSYVDVVKAVITGRLERLAAAYEMGDFLTAQESAKVLGKAFKGLPELEKVEEIRASVAGDDKAQAVIKAQEEIADLRAEADELRKKKDAEKLLDELREIQKEMSGTYAAEQASQLANDIRKALPGLR